LLNYISLNKRTQRIIPSLRRYLSLFLIVLITLTATSFAPSRMPDPNNKIRMLYIWSCTQAVQWPETSNNSAEFTIGVYGESELFSEISTAIGPRKVGTKPVLVKSFESLSKVDQVQILYVTPERSSDIPALVNKFAGKGVLIISEKEGMAKKGGSTINFIFKESKLKYEFNKSNAEKFGLKLGLQLATLGVEVN
jgi:hypothetical protein